MSERMRVLGIGIGIGIGEGYMRERMRVRGTWYVVNIDKYKGYEVKNESPRHLPT